jgi:hypothetical protein
MSMQSEWERCKPWIEGALAHAKGTHAIEDVEAGVATGQFLLWPGDRSAALTEIHQFPRARFLHVFLAGGDLNELRDQMVPMWRVYAKLKECSHLTICGRRGWERALKKQGWQADLVCLDLPVSQEPKQ